MPSKEADAARQVLAQCVLFRGLPAAACGELVRHAKLRRCQPGETIFLMGSDGDSMMAVLDGTVRISVSSQDGKEIILALLRRGQFFGEIALLDGLERTANAIAATPVTLAVLERRDVLRLLEAHPEAWPSLVRVLCERLRATDQHIAEVALLPLSMRLSRTLLRLSDPDEGGGPIHLSQREIGNLVGASRESVNKCLRDWQERGVIRMEDHVISIVRRAMLERLTEE
jgi:CRP-like cAMP-binding protein